MPEPHVPHCPTKEGSTSRLSAKRMENTHGPERKTFICLTAARTLAHTHRKINYGWHRGSSPIPPTSLRLLKRSVDRAADFLPLRLKESKTGEDRTVCFLFLSRRVIWPCRCNSGEGPTRFIKIRGACPGSPSSLIKPFIAANGVEL